MKGERERDVFSVMAKKVDGCLYILVSSIVGPVPLYRRQDLSSCMWFGLARNERTDIYIYLIVYVCSYNI